MIKFVGGPYDGDTAESLIHQCPMFMVFVHDKTCHVYATNGPPDPIETQTVYEYWGPQECAKFAQGLPELREE